MNTTKTIGITLGDPAGIGPEVIIKSLNNLSIPENVKILLIGDYSVVRCLDLPKNLSVYKNIKDWEEANTPLNLLDMDCLGSNCNIRFGFPNPEYAEAAYKYLIKACELIKKASIDRLITGPVNKEVINSAGFSFTGHTEFFSKEFSSDKVEMMLFSKDIKFVLLTRHISLKDVSRYITQKRLVSLVELVNNNFKKIFKVPEVKLAVTGINPHLSDKGLIGKEEVDVIIPAVDNLKHKYNIIGPLSLSDAVKLMEKRSLDVTICMYHDQALVPLKLLYPYKGINLTLGLPFIRTSPLHGTAYNIAGKNIASSKSMEETLQFTMSI